jgi:hypothetical protein
MERSGFGFIPPVPPVPPAAPAAPRRSYGEPAAEKKTGASEDEKKLILQMLQDKKITAEEADKLLEALES